MNQRVALPPHRRMRQPPLSRSETIQTEQRPIRLIGADELLQTWDQGIPSVHIYVVYGPALGNGDHPPNCKLVIHATWSSDEAGGKVDIDATCGVSFTLGASMRSIGIDASFELVDMVVPAVIQRPADATVSVVIGGQGTLSGKKPTFATPRYIVVASEVTAIAPIPSMAVKGRIVTSGEAPRGDINLWLDAGANAAAPISVQNGDDGWLEVGGATHYQLQNVGAIDTKAFVIWELSI